MNTDFFILMKSELSVTLIIFTLLILKVWDGIKNNSVLLHVTNVLLFVNLIIGFFFNSDGELFSGMYHTDNVIAAEKIILNLGTLIISLQSFEWLKTHKHMLEFYILLLSTLLGLFFMISSGNFLMFFLGLELSSIPLAALVNFDLDKIKSSEAAVKMILSSAFASGIMLFGISILYGTTGTLNFDELSKVLSGEPLQLFALLFVFSGFAFKLSSVPFHFWTADVYEGAPVPVASYLSVISKAAIVFVTISVLSPLFAGFPNVWYPVLFISIIFTIAIGNLFALRQENIKRFLAFSSIAQVGYILLGISAGNKTGDTSAIYFLLVYLFSNLGAFGVVSWVSAQTNKENIMDYNGFYKTNPVLSWIITISLFSLAGIPPTAGFFGKMFLVTAGASSGNYILISFAAINMVVSLYYYLRIVRAIFIEENDNPIPALNGSASTKLGLLICVIGTIVVGLTGGIFEYLISIIK